MAIARAGRTDEEAARALVRELHEAIQDGRALLRELRAAMAEADGKTAGVEARANETLAQLQDHVDVVVGEVSQQLEDNREAMSRQIDEVLTMGKPDELLRTVAREVTVAVKEAALDYIARKLPGIVAAEMEVMAARGSKKYGSYVNAALALSDAALRAELAAGNGADGTVGGPPGP